MVIGGVEGKGHIGERDRHDRPGDVAAREFGLRARSYREGLADAIEWFYKAGSFKCSPNPGSVQRTTHGRRECRCKRGTMTVSSEAFLSQLTAVAADIESLIDRLLAAPAIEGERARPRRLLDAMRYASLNGGKRFRPFLVVATAALFDVPRQRALMVGAALECVHCYSLVHDDLPAMDDDDLRRGQPTAHKAFDEATAILAGDGLLTFAFDILARPDAHPDPAVRIELLQALARASGLGGMVGGQMLDLSAEGRFADGRP
jgi:farnesyl diphosphate synthase